MSDTRWTEHIKNEAILLKHKHAEMLSLYRKIVTSISKMTLVSLHINVTLSWGRDMPTFDVTVFDGIHDNTSFTCYDFRDIGAQGKIFDELVRIIRKDDFSKVKEFKQLHKM